MELPMLFAMVFTVYLIIYIIAQGVGVERLKQRGLDASVPFFVMIRTQRLNSLLTRTGKRIPRWVFNIGIVVGFLGMGFGFILFTSNLVAFFLKPEDAGGVVPIIPGVTITGMPLVYMIVGLAVTLITHEFAHGLAAARDNIPIKSAGLLFLFILFGGFVEPDENVFEENVTSNEAQPEKKATPQERMRVLAAGSFSNMAWALVFMIVIANFYPLMSIGFSPGGTYVYQIAEGAPADGVLQVGDVINALNNTKINSWAELGAFMSNTRAGSILIVCTNRGNFSLTLAQAQPNTNRGYMGIYGTDYWAPRPGWEWMPDVTMFAFHTQQILIWSYLLLLSVAIFNLLPIPILDGDKLLSNGLSLVIKNKETVSRIMWPLRITTLVIVVTNVILSYMTGKGLF